MRGLIEDETYFLLEGVGDSSGLASLSFSRAHVNISCEAAIPAATRAVPQPNLNR